MGSSMMWGLALCVGAGLLVQYSHAVMTEREHLILAAGMTASFRMCPH
jgi:hypothetical protein